MSGNLAYELRGPLEDGPEIYDAVFRAGQDLGIQRLGWRDLPRQPRRGRLPADELAFMSAADREPGYREFVARPAASARR